MVEDDPHSIDNENEAIVGALDGKDKVTELDAVLDVNVEITAVLGTTLMPIGQVLQLGRGAVVTLDRGVDEDIEILANNRLVATGEVVMIDKTNDGITHDDKVGVKINNVLRLPKSLTG